MEKELISVIVPVYQVKDYLRATLDSVLSQSYENWELILVDDGSSDGSGEICDEYAGKDTRIRVVHQQNQGVSAARNLGMELAEGEYLTFLDADDLIEKDYLRVLWQDAKEYGAAVVCCNGAMDWNGRREKYSSVLAKRRIQSKEVCFRDLYQFRELYGHGMFGKLFQTGIAKRHPFEKLCYGEDKLFVLQIFAEEPVVYLDDYDGYVYVRHEGSVTMRNGGRNVANQLDAAEVAARLMELVEDLSEDTRRLAAVYLARCIHNAAACTVFAGGDAFQRNRQRLLGYVACSKKYWKMITGMDRLRLWLYRYIPAGYRLCVWMLTKIGRA